MFRALDLCLLRCFVPVICVLFRVRVSPGFVVLCCNRVCSGVRDFCVLCVCMI